MNIVLYQPEIALNLGAIIRLSACLNCNLHVIEPCGFPFNVRKIRESALDYFDKLSLTRHDSWQSFVVNTPLSAGKKYLLTTKASDNYYEAKYEKNSYLIFGSESRGVGQEVVDACDKSYKIEMNSECRSLNLATSVAMVAGEAIRQVKYG